MKRLHGVSLKSSFIIILVILSSLWTSSFLEAQSQSTTINMYLVKGGDPNGTDENGDPLILQAASAGMTDVVNLLIERGADVNAKSRSGRTALMEAVAGGWEDMVQTFMVSGADINAIDTNGWAAWTIALNNEHIPGLHGVEIAKMLSGWAMVSREMAALFIPEMIRIEAIDTVVTNLTTNLIVLPPGPHKIIVSYCNRGRQKRIDGNTVGAPLLVDMTGEKGGIYTVRYQFNQIQEKWNAVIERYK